MLLASRKYLEVFFLLKLAKILHSVKALEGILGALRNRAGVS